MGVYDFIGGDPQAQAVAELSYLMKGDAGGYVGRTPTESAHIDVISERLRLLYVGITRAKRFLQLSRSRYVRTYSGQDREAESAEVVGVLYHFLEKYKQTHAVGSKR